MNYILIGLCGFGFAFLFDWMSLKRLSLIKPATWVVALFLITYAIIKLCLTAPSTLPVVPKNL